MSRTTDMTTGNPRKHILSFAFPLIITNLGQQLYMIADSAIVGRGVGVKALAAVGATDWIYWMFLWTAMGLTQGFSTFISRYFGHRDYHNLNKTIAMSTLLCTITGILLTITGILTARPLLELLHTPDDIIDGAATYLITLISGTLIIIAYNMSASILRAFGDGKSPLYAMIIAALLNIGLDLLFVFVFKWGIFGAAIASVISQLVAFIYCLLQIRKIECVKLDKEVWKPDYKLIKNLLVFGIPLALQNIVIALGGIILQSSVNLQGSIFGAGYTATNKVYGLLEGSAISLGASASTFIAQNFGARKLDRVKAGVKTSVRIVVVMALIVMAFSLLVRNYLLQLFLDVTEEGGPEALEIGIRYLIILAVSLILLYLLHVFRNVLQAIGISVWSFISGLVECVARVIMAKFFITWLGSDALFIAEPVAWLGGLLALIVPYIYYNTKLLKD